MSRRQCFSSSRRRAQLAVKPPDRLELLEPKTTITEPISALGLLSAFRSLASIGLIDLSGSSDALKRLQSAAELMRKGQARGMQPTAVRCQATSTAGTFTPIFTRY